MSITNQESVLRFRHHRALAVAGITVTISTFTLAAVSVWFLLALIPPLIWTVGIWRAGTDADSTGLRVRALLGQRRIPWTDVEALVVAPNGRVVARLTKGTAVPLTAVTAADLPQLVAASGQPLAQRPLSPAEKSG
ncbi:MAG TPA: PH domain-containing protein [Natronosporangium sp.]|nr:PH domain-containing protein [Natronosporangium sp.]